MRCKRYIVATLGMSLSLLLSAHLHVTLADEAPTILIEDVILTCTGQAQRLSMPSTELNRIDERAVERLFHRDIAQLCQGETVCRIPAGPLLSALPQNSGCDDVVIVPVCAVGAFESLTPNTSTEMTLQLREQAALIINCSGRATPHF